MSLGFIPRIAKTPDTLIARADEVIDKVKTLRVEVVTKQDEHEARLRRLDLQSGRRTR